MMPIHQSLQHCASLVLPRGNSREEREQFRTDCRRAMDSGRTTFLVWASHPPSPQSIADLQDLLESSHTVHTEGTGRVRCLIVDNILLAKRVRADGVLFSQQPQTSYARAREVLGSRVVIGRLVSKGDASRICEQEADADQIDVLVVSEEPSARPV